MRRLIPTILLLAISSTGFPAAEKWPPLVVAVDTSRSLSAADLRHAGEKISSDIEALPAGIPIGLIAFDDTARWLSEPASDRDEVLTALRHLKPAGRYTVLNEALFLAARSMEEGGIILLISDGKDENSAIQVEDLHRLCGDNGVVILSMAGGRRIDEQALRRISMLSGGHFLGLLNEVESGDFKNSFFQLEENLRKLKAEAATPAPPALVTPGTTENTEKVLPTHPASRIIETRVFTRWLPLFLFVVVLAGILIWILLRKKKKDPSLCPVCGHELEEDGWTCQNCEMQAIEDAVHQNKVADSLATAPRELDPEALARETLPGNMEKTMALGDVAILTVREEGLPERAFSLPRGHVFAVGRAPGVNTLVMEDPTISSQHFKILYRDGNYFVVDLGTTNGTTVNSEKIRVRRLTPGDTVRAGLTDFVFSHYGTPPPLPPSA